MREIAMSRTTTSLRLDDELKGQLDELASLEGTTVSALIERYVREGLRMSKHRGIIFNPGPSGRRATLSAGPDVWEVASALRNHSGTEAEKTAALAEEFGIHPRQIEVALNYMAAYPEEIESRVRANDQAWEEIERLEIERKRLLA
jgi:hypothetical protein